MAASQRVLIHATSVVLAEAAAPFGGALDLAVLLLGPSDAGKSDVALRLIAAGATLLADDQTALFVQDGRLCAEAPPSLHGQVEVRGVGILKLQSAKQTVVGLAVYLEPERKIARMPEPASYRLPDPLQAVVAPPLLTLRPFEASTPAKISAAAACNGKLRSERGLTSGVT